ncbi:MAG: hypothetical protein N3F66_12785 [Spirochaetes bacterium]|nr:hypothetical protein [Spirochaetota bacterium]
MKKSKIAILLCGLLIAVIIGAITFAQLEDKAKKGQAISSPRITYKNYIWIEGENAVSTNFAREPIYNFFCSNKFALQLSKDVEPPQEGYFATYVFYVTHTKEYDLWMGCTPPGSRYKDRPGYASPIEWKIDNGPFQTASAENVYVKSFYGIGGYYWVKIASGTLNAGKHTLTIRVKQKRSSGWDYYFYIDAIVLFPQYSTGIAKLMDFPEVWPQDFTTPGDGIIFNTPEFYEKKLRANISDREALFTLVQIYGWLYDYNKAIFLLQKYLEKNPRDIDMRLQLAAFYSWSDQLDAAISEYKNIISIDEKNITARKLLSVLAGWNNRYDEAIKYYQEIIAIEPENVDAYVSLATQYSWKGEMNRAIATFEKAESLAPNNADVLEVLGDNYYWAGRAYDAIRQYYRIIDIDEKRISAYKKLAKIYLDLGESAKASKIINDAKQVVDLYPELSGISLDVKDELAKERKALIESYKEALVKNPDDINLRKGLVDTYIWNRMYADAVREYDALLAYKMFHSIEQAEQKLARLAIHTVGLQSLKPVITHIQDDVRTLQKQYAKLIADKKKGIIAPPSIARDRARLEAYAAKLKDIQKELYLYNDIIAAFGKDVQTYTAMQAATGFQLEHGRILRYAATATKLNPQLYQPYKVQGTIELLYGSPSRSIDYFETVKKLSATAEFPGLPMAYAQTEKFSRAIALLEESLQNKKIATGYKTDIEAVLSLAKLDKGEEAGIQASVSDFEESLSNVVTLLEAVSSDVDQKLVFGCATIRNVYEKQFMDLELDNARIYKEIANFYLQNGNYNASREYYSNILKVQPLNVEANFAMGSINELLGYWKDAKENYEICINAQPDFEHARKAHYELQKQHAPSISANGIYFHDNIRTRFGIDVSGLYEPSQYFTLQAGYEFRKQTDTGGIATTGQLFYPSDGNVTMHRAFAQMSIPVRILYMRFFAQLGGNMYSGTVNYGNPLYDSTLNYMSLTYGAGVWWTPPATGITVKVTYSHDDENDLTQSLKMKFRDAITYDMIEGILDINFSEYNFPLSKRLFLYNNVQYRMLSDSNTRMSSFNQLTVRVYRIPQWNMFFDVAGIYAYEDTKFTRYTSGDILLVPYWAPQGISYYGPMAKVTQQVENIFGGTLLYSVFFQYMNNSIEQRIMMPGMSVSHNWDKLQIFAEYMYSNVTLPNSTIDKRYISHDLKFGATGKFFSIYTPKGAGGKPVLFVSPNPTLITPDGDGKDDFTTLSLTAFDEKGIQQWWIEILNEKGEKVQEYSLAGAVPATFRWDGTGRNNILVPEGKYYVQLTIQNSAGQRFSSKKQEIVLATAKRAIALTPSYTKFSPNGDKIKDTISFVIQATDKKNVAQWFITVSSKNKIVKTIKGNDFIPYDVLWDGNDDNLKPVPDGEYTAKMTIKYDDGIVVASPSAIITVVTKVAVDIKVEPNEVVPIQTTLRITPTIDGDVTQWQVRFMRDDGAVVKVINGAGTPPKVISWDGTDDKGQPAVYNMQLAAQMEITDDAGNTALSKKVPFMVGFLVKQEKGKRIVYMFNQDTIFKGRSDELTVHGVFILDQLAGKLTKMAGFTKITIVAYTDTMGSKQSNMALSQKQATVIADRLKNLPAEIKAVGAGSELLYLKDKPSKWDMRYEIELY